MLYNIISTGSKGNATIIHDKCLIDCGISYKAIKPYLKDIKVILLTHEHGDHFKKSTIKNIANDKPLIKFVCCEYLVKKLLDQNVPKQNIVVVETDVPYQFMDISFTPVHLIHNVPNVGYKINTPEGTVFYATDTNELKHIEAKDYDLYLIEANYEDNEIHNWIKYKKAKGEYAYREEVLNNHLSKKKADNWLAENCTNGKFIYMHQHEEHGT